MSNSIVNFPSKGLTLSENIRKVLNIHYPIRLYYNLGIRPLKEFGNINNQNTINTFSINQSCGKIKICSFFFMFRYNPDINVFIANSRYGEITLEDVRTTVKEICVNTSTALLCLKHKVPEIENFAKLKLNFFPKTDIYFYNELDKKINKILKSSKKNTKYI